MVKIQRIGVLFDDFRKLYGRSVGEKAKHFWAEGWKNFPELMGLLPLCALSVVGSVYICIKSLEEPKQPKYRHKLTIFRPDDPRVAHIRQEETLQDPLISLDIYNREVD